MLLCVQVLCGGGSADRAAAATAELLEVRSTRADIQAKEYMLPDMVGRCMAVAHQLFVVVLTPAVMGAPDGYHGFVATCHGQIFAPPGKEIDLQRAMVIPNNEVIACLNVGDHFAAVPLPVDLKLRLLPEDHHQRKDLFGSSEGRTVVAGVVARHWRAAMPACNGACLGCKVPLLHEVLFGCRCFAMYLCCTAVCCNAAVWLYAAYCPDAQKCWLLLIGQAAGALQSWLEMVPCVCLVC